MSKSFAGAQFALMASYNQWMNEKLYEAAARLPEAELTADRGAFFGSLTGTLNHLVIADTIWLQRFTQHPTPFRALDAVRVLPAPAALSAEDLPALPVLFERRRLLDTVIKEWIDEISDADYEQVVEYKTMKGVPGAKRLANLLLHFFNHQTHHRGQATTLLSQAGVDVGVTDLLVLIPNDEVGNKAD